MAGSCKPPRLAPDQGGGDWGHGRHRPEHQLIRQGLTALAASPGLPAVEPAAGLRTAQPMGASGLPSPPAGSPHFAGSADQWLWPELGARRTQAGRGLIATDPPRAPTWAPATYQAPYPSLLLFAPVQSSLLTPHPGAAGCPGPGRAEPALGTDAGTGRGLQPDACRARAWCHDIRPVAAQARSDGPSSSPSNRGPWAERGSHGGRLTQGASSPLGNKSQQGAEAKAMPGTRGEHKFGSAASFRGEPRRSPVGSATLRPAALPGARAPASSLLLDMRRPCPESSRVVRPLQPGSLSRSRAPRRLQSCLRSSSANCRHVCNTDRS